MRSENTEPWTTLLVSLAYAVWLGLWILMPKRKRI